MTIKIPKNYMGKPIEGSLERVLASASTQNIPDSAPVIQPIVVPSSVIVNDPQNYIILPSKSHGNYSYPDLLVAMDRTHQGKNWTDAHAALHQEDAFMINIRQFVDFLNLLKSGAVLDGTGNPVPQPRIQSILDEILTVRSPWRSEWLDAKFEVKGGNILGMGKETYVNYDYRNGQSTVAKKLADYLKLDKTPGIDIDDWLANADQYGLPKESVKQGNLYYWYPRDGAVARFYAVSGRADLYCSWVPSYSDASLGVRAARAKN